MENNRLNKWEFKRTSSGIFIRSKSLLKYQFNHGFFTKDFTNKSPVELSSFLDIGLSIHNTRQVHGDNIIQAKECLQNFPVVADAIISDQKKQSLWIYSADCIPVLIADKVKGIVSACHAGWRGVANRIVVKTITTLESLGSNKSDLIITMGPAISGEEYQVELEVAKNIFISLFKEGTMTRNKLKNYIDHLILLKIVTENINKKRVKVDIKISLKNQLINFGLKRKQINICPLCTYSEKSLFHSRRREKGENIQWSGIASR